MRNLRKLTAVVIAIALVLTSMTAAFAADTTAVNSDKATVLNQLGLYTGTSDKEFVPDLGSKLTREQATTLLLKMFGLEAKAKEMKDADVKAALAGFKDADKVSGWAKNAVAYAVANKIMSGSAKGIDPQANVTGAQYATLIVKSMGYDVKDWTKAVTQLSEIKGSAVKAEFATSDLTRDNAVGYMYGALTAETKAGKTVIAGIVGTDAAKLAIATKAGLFGSTGTLDVVSTTATNLRELVVTFNKEVPNATEAKKKENYKIGSNNPEAVTLSDDNKTVTLRTSSANAMGNYGTVDLTIEKAVGFDAKKEIKAIAIKDTTVPSAVSVKATGPKNLKVTLSEPLKTDKVKDGSDLSGVDIAASVKIDGGVVAVDTTNSTTSGIELNIKTYSTLSEGSHKIEFLGDKYLQDNAGYKIQGATLTFDYVKDTSDLTLSYVESNETSATFKFNKTIDTTTLIGNGDVKFRHTYNSSTSYDVTGKSKDSEGSIVNSGDDQKFTVNFNKSNPLPPTTVTVYIDGYDKIKDCYGNALKTSSFTVTTVADTVKPTATAEFVNADEIKVTYSEAVEEGALDINNYVLKINSDVIPLKTPVFVGDSGNKVVKLVPQKAQGFNGTTYTLAIKNVKDKSVAKNKIDDVTLTFTGTDKVAPTVDSVTLVADKKIKVKFSEIMDVATITSKSLYKLSLQSSTNTAIEWVDDDKFEAVDGNKAALITLKTAPAKDVKYLLTIGWIKDLAGNVSKEYQTIKEFTGNVVDKVGLKEYSLIAKDQIKLKFEDTLNSMVPGDFAYSKDGGSSWTTVSKSLGVSVEDGNTYITLYTDDLGTTTPGAIVVKSVNSKGTDPLTATTYTKNGFDTTLSFVTLPGKAIDKCAPSKSSIKVTDIADKNETSTGRTLNTVEITYSEPIYASSLQEADYTVANYEVDKVGLSADRKTVIITVKTLDYGSFEIGKTEVKVKQVGDISDDDKNVLGAQDEWTAK